MKNLLTLFLALLSLPTIAQLNLVDAYSLDVASAVYLQQGQEESPVIFANYQDSIPGLEGSKKEQGAAVIVYEDTLLNIGDFCGDQEINLQGFTVNEEIELTSILLQCSGPVKADQSLELEEYFEFDSLDNQYGIIHISDSPDSIWTATIIAPENTLPAVYSFDELSIMTGTFKDSLIYTNGDQDPVIIKADGHHGYAFAIDGLGTYQWGHTFQANGLNFIRSAAVFNEKLLISHDNIKSNKIFSISADGALDTLADWAVTRIHSIKVHNDKLYLTGHYSEFGNQDISLNDTPYMLPMPNESDIYISCYDTDLETQWVQVVSGDRIDTGVDLAISETGDVYVTGCIQRDATFGAGQEQETTKIADGAEDIFLARYSPDGELQWVETFGGSGVDIGYKVSVIEDFVINFGIYRDSMDADPSDQEFIIANNHPNVESSYYLTVFYEFPVSTEEEEVTTPLLGPNPTQGLLTLRDSDSTIKYIRDLNGRIVQQVDEQSTDISHLKAGIYFAELIHADGKHSLHRVVKVK